MAENEHLKQIYFNEYNMLMGNSVYFPLVSGMLQAYAQTKDVIKKNYQFMPFIFFRDDPDKIISTYQNPSVAAFSASMWNMNLCLIVAKRVKEKFPNCLIVFGGPHVPFEPTDLLQVIFKLTEQIETDSPALVNGYGRAVTREGNLKAQQIMQMVFDIKDVEWRGIGTIPQSGLKFSPAFAAYDAEQAFDLDLPDAEDPKGCACGEILTGTKIQKIQE